MSNPAFVSPQNVKFNGTLSDAVVFNNAAGIRTLALWADLPGVDQQHLIDLAAQYGNTIPLASPVGANQDLVLRSGVVGSTSTGLNAVAVLTAGKATVDLGTSKAGTDLSGLSSSRGTAGYGLVNFQPEVTGSTNLGLSSPYAGLQFINFGTRVVSTNPTGLLNTSAVYTMNVTVDGIVKPISLVGSAAQTFTALISEINTDLGASAVASIVGGNIKIASTTTGSSSTISISDGTLLAALTGFISIFPAVNGSGATSYTASVNINGVVYPLTVDPTVTNTFTQLLAVINAAITVNGTAALTGGDLRITSATLGTSSKVRINAGTLFSSIVHYMDIIPSADGGGLSRTYSAQVLVDGLKLKSVRFLGTAGTTLTDVITEINADLGADATAAITGGDIVITSSTTGKDSSVVIYDAGLFSALKGFVSIASSIGDAPTLYTAQILLTNNGVVTTKSISLAGNTVQNITTLVSALTTQLGSDVTVTLTSSNITFTNTKGITDGATISTIQIVPGTLFLYIAPVLSISPARPLVSSFLDVLKNTKTPNGASFFSTLPIRTVGVKPVVPPYVKHTLAFIYFNGTAFAYLDNDVLVNA